MTDHSATGGTSSSSSCNNGHVFFYAGAPPIPNGFPCACGLTKYRASTTSDPQAAYSKKREPMLKDRAVSDLSCSDRGIQLARDFYEDKIRSGELIVKSELVEWLCKQGDTPFKHPNMEVRGYNIAIKDVLDHINKKGSTTP